MSLKDVTVCHVDYIELKAIKTLQDQKKLWPLP